MKNKFDWWVVADWVLKMTAGFVAGNIIWNLFA
jgi:hypothetical protein